MTCRSIGGDSGRFGHWRRAGAQSPGLDSGAVGRGRGRPQTAGGSRGWSRASLDLWLGSRPGLSAIAVSAARVQAGFISRRIRHRVTGLLRLITVAAVGAAALAAVLAGPASAQLQQVTVQLPDGTLTSVVIDLPPGTTLSELQSGQVTPADPLPGTPVSLEPIGEDPPTSDPDPPADPPPTSDPNPPADPPPPPDPNPPAAP